MEFLVVGEIWNSWGGVLIISRSSSSISYLSSNIVSSHNIILLSLFLFLSFFKYDNATNTNTSNSTSNNNSSILANGL